MFDLGITGGEVVFPHGVSRADLWVRDGRIVGITAPGEGGQARRVIPAEGLLILPGGVDPHTHLSLPYRGGQTVGFETITAAAACGGTTTFLDFAFMRDGESLGQAIARRRQEAEGKSAIDFGLHGGITFWSRALLDELPRVVEGGVPSFKVFMTPSSEGPALNDGELLSVLQAVGRLGGVVGLHAENPQMIAQFTNELLEEGRTGLDAFPLSRREEVEDEAVHRAIFLAGRAGTPVYFFHLSSAGAVGLIREARAQGEPVFGETCPHYLSFTDEVYREERGIFFVRFPSVKGPASREALWSGVADGTISVIGSDEVTLPLALKKALAEGKPFHQLPGGMPQIETRLPLLYTEMVVRRGMHLRHFVDLVSTNAAKLFGLYPRKGVVAVGSDADLVLFDPAKEKVLTAGDLHMGAGYTIFEGWKLTGYPVMTIARGKVIVENGEFVGKVGEGQYLRRRMDPEALRRLVPLRGQRRATGAS